MNSCQSDRRLLMPRLAVVLVLSVVLAAGCSDSGDSPTGPDPDPGPGGDVPELETLVPGRTFAGDTLRILGSGFGAEADEESVLFSAGGGARATAEILAWSDLEVRVLVPEDAVTGPVVVTRAGEESEALSFTVVAPVSLQVDVRPIFQQRGCLSCHGGTNGLELSTHAGILAGGIRGPAVVPRRGAESLLVMAMRGQGGVPQMPFGSPPMPEAEILLISDWIDQGARDN